MSSAIVERRSVRKYKSAPVPKEVIAVGYADEAPFARPRKGMDAAAEWRT